MSTTVNMPVESPVAASCRDCGAPLPEAAGFCPACGQETQVRLPRVFDFLREAADETVGLSGRLPRTLALLLFRPGRLTTEYVGGRRQRYVRPMRLYLSVSLVFFGLLSLATSDLGWLQLPSLGDSADQIKAATREAASKAGGGSSQEIETADHGDGTAAPGAKKPDAPATAKTGEPPQPEPALPEVDLTTLARPAAKTAASASTSKPAGSAEPDAATAPANAAANAELDEKPTDIPWLNRRFEHYKSMPQREIVNTLIKGVQANAPYAVFILMPLAALWYQLFYLLRGRRYAEHLLHAVHLHCFAFCVGTLALIPLGGNWRLWLFAVLGLYTVIAEMRVYGSGLPRALIGTAIGSFLYFIGITFTAALLAIIALAV